jgi:hypothetical protein
MTYVTANDTHLFVISTYLLIIIVAQTRSDGIMVLYMYEVGTGSTRERRRKEALTAF